MKRLSIFIVISFLCTSCGIDSTPSASPTIFAFPTTSSTTAIPSSTILPSPSPTAIPVSYIYGDEVTIEERTEIELGMQTTYSYLSELGLGSPGPLTVYALYDVQQMTDVSYPLYGPEFGSTKEQVRSIWESAAGNSPNDIVVMPTSISTKESEAPSTIIIPTSIPTGGGLDPLAAIFVLTSIPKRVYDQPCYKVAYVAHDIWHLMQRQWAKLPLRSGYPMPRTGAEWLKEGSAQFFASKVAERAHPNTCNYELNLSDEKTASYSAPQLSSMESSTSLATEHQAVMSQGPYAVDYLVTKSPKGIESLKDFYEAIGRGFSWNEAFQDAFGQTATTFYSTFQAYEKQDLSSLIDETACKDSVSSGDFTVKCLGRLINSKTNPNNNDEILFKVSGFDSYSFLTKPPKLSSNCQLAGNGLNPPLLYISVDHRYISQTCTLVVSPDESGQSGKVTFMHIGTSIPSDKSGFDASYCANADFVSSGDFQVDCVGRNFIPDYYSVDYQFKISGYDISNIDLDSPGTISSNCKASWDLLASKSILVIDMAYNLTKSPIKCTVTFSPPSSGKMVQFTFNHNP